MWRRLVLPIAVDSWDECNALSIPTPQQHSRLFRGAHNLGLVDFHVVSRQRQVRHAQQISLVSTKLTSLRNRWIYFHLKLKSLLDIFKT